MQNSKLIILLKALNAEEFRQFYRYVKAPFSTKSKELIQFYDYIRKYYPDFANDKLDRKTIFASLYPNESFNSPRLRNLALKVTKILEDYLIYLEYQQNDIQKKQRLAHIYGKRNINVIFKQKTTELLADLDKQPFRNTHYFYDSYQLQQAYYFHVNTSKQGEMVEMLKNALKNLDHFYHIERLRLGVDLKNRERIFSECHDFNSASISPNGVKDVLIYRLFKKLLCLCETEESAIFYEVKKLFEANIQEIAEKDGLIILPSLLNYAIRQFASRETEFLKEAFELYQLGIDSKLLISNNVISEATFLNIVIIGSKLKKFDYIQSFIERYDSKIKISFQTDLKVLALSFLYFNQGNYQQVSEMLQAFGFTHSMYKITARVLLIRTYYHLYEEDETLYKMLLANCDAFERFFRRMPNLNSKKLEAALNFVFLLRKIIKQKQLRVGRKNAKEELNHLLKNFTNVYAKGWLKIMIDSL